MSSCCPSKNEKPSSCHESKASKPDWLLRLTCTLVISLYGLNLLFSHTKLISEFLISLSGPVYELINTMWWGVALAVLFVGVLDYVPQQWVTKALGKGDSFGGSHHY